MATTSINVQPCKVESSELHNTREKVLDYVRPELSDKNEKVFFSDRSLGDELAQIKEAYKAAKGRKLHAKATPLREGVIVISEDTTLDHLIDFAEKCEDRWGLKPLQIYIHKDEGHWKTVGEEKVWKPNLHAHIVWRWCDDIGITYKLNKQDMAEMQTLLSVSLNMKRGKSSDKIHLNSIQYKVAQDQKKLDQLEPQLEEAKEIIASAEKARNEIAEQREILKQGKQILDSRLSQINDLGKDLTTIQEQEIKPFVMETFENHKKLGGLKYDKEGFVNELTQYMTNAGYAKKTEDVIIRTKTDFQELETQNLKSQVKRLSEKNQQLTDELNDLKNTLFQTLGNGFKKLFDDCREWLKNINKALKTALKLNSREEEWDDTNRVWLKANDDLDGLLINDTPLQEYKQTQNRTHVRGIRR